MRFRVLGLHLKVLEYRLHGTTNIVPAETRRDAGRQ